MPLNRDKTNYPSKEKKGNPSDTGSDKAGINPIGQAEENPERFDELEAKYTEGENEPAQDLVRHKNRNYNKPDIDKPRYS